MRLDKLEIGKDAIVASVDSDDAALYQHILDMGLTPGTEVTMMKHAPMGDPVEIRLRDYELTLRLADAARIELVDVHDAHNAPRENPALRHPNIPPSESASVGRAQAGNAPCRRAFAVRACRQPELR